MGRVRSERNRVPIVAVALVTFALVVLVVVAVVVVTGGGEGGGDAIRITDVACGSGWQPPRAGVHVFTVRNDSHTAADIDLVAAVQPRVFGALDLIAAGTTRTLAVRLPPGRYQWRCGLASGANLLSRAERVTGPAQPGVRASQPVTLDDLTPVASEARDRTAAGLAVLATDTDALQASVDGGRLDEARARWLTAYLDYERLGVAYGTFGDFDAKIDGRPDGLRGGAADPDWTGFLRLEHALWNGEPPATAAAVADRLDHDVHALVADFPDEFTDVRDVPLRVHEILENTLQFVLTGDADEGSHTELATARANVDGTRATLAAVAPLLQTRTPALLGAATRGLDRFAALLDSYRTPGGGWTPLPTLTRMQREALDGAASELVETLAPIPDVLELPRDADKE